VKRTRLKAVGRKMQTDARELKRITPYLAERCGGFWISWDVVPHATGCHCEVCGAAIWDILGARAHIDERSDMGKNTAGNLIVACGTCHDHGKYADGGLACGTVEAKRIVKERNERMEAE
jgi:hypothetical protein